MIEQMTIFELVDTKDVPWQELSDQEIADRIASRFGVIAKKDSFDGYKFSKKGCDVRVSKGRYAPSVYNGVEYIGVGIMNKNRTSGMSCPCDSIEEAIERIEFGLKSIAREV